MPSSHRALPPYPFLLLALLFFGATGSAGTVSRTTVPEFTPNVVDAARVLTPDDIREINDTLREIRDKADIWGAVLIVDQLGEDSIEDLAERAFRQWKLGMKGKDNGLLLVLAMKDRKSRFEVGYGLEGDLPDVIARRALDDVLRPYMRRGETKTAIVQSFRHLAAIKAKDPALAGAAPIPAATESGSSDLSDLDVRKGLAGLLLFYACLWLLFPVARAVAVSRARRLEKVYPAYTLAGDKTFSKGRLGARQLFFGNSIGGSLLLKGFLSINPGVFILIGCGLHPLVLPGFAGACALFAVLVFRAVTGRYRSKETYEAFIERARRRNRRLLDAGYMRETSPGQFEYTEAYYSSDEYRASRSSSSSGSSSSSRSSSSSSSGGGRSGGGGASSSW